MEKGVCTMYVGSILKSSMQSFLPFFGFCCSAISTSCHIFDGLYFFLSLVYSYFW